MGATRPSSPRPAAARSAVVVGFYLAMGLVAFFWYAIAADSNAIWGARSGMGLSGTLGRVVLGLLVGASVVAGFRWLEPRAAFVPALRAEFGALLGRPTRVEVLLLAGASALGEELLFRGAALHSWGVLGSSAVFALLHLPPRRALWPWTASAFAMGLVFAGLARFTGDLTACFVAHFAINAINLRDITHGRPAPSLRGPAFATSTPISRSRRRL